MERVGESLSTRQHTLYRFFNANHDLLYVGITANPTARLKKHAAEKEWWLEIATVKMEHFSDRQSVLAAERAAIKSEHPLHNVRMNGDARREAQAPAEIDGLVGRFFHSWVEKTDETSEYATIVSGRVLQWQGHVVEQIDRGIYMIELFSWGDGQPNGQQIALLADMASWTFYDNGLEMQIALGCRESGRRWLGRDGACGNECTHVTYALGIGTVCGRCAGSYSWAVEIVWKNGRCDEKATLAALDRLVPATWK